MERLIETLVREIGSAEAGRRGAPGCDECLRARPSADAPGVCTDHRAQLERFLAARLRRRPTGAAAFARLVEDARRFARAQASLAGSALRLAPFGAHLERPLEAYPVDSSS